jgi:hypothetical protein
MTIPENPCAAGWRYEMTFVHPHERNVRQVSSRLRIPADDLKMWNSLDESGALFEGQRIVYCRDRRPGSIGFPWRGGLRSGVNLDSNGDGHGCGWALSSKRVHTFGTRETVADVSDCLCRYRSQFADGPDISVGDLSRRGGGRLAGHRSHRSGRDIDLGYITDPPQTEGFFNTRANSRNLDAEKQWWLLKCFLDKKSLEYVFMNWGPISAVRKVVESRPEDAFYLRYFPGGEEPVIMNDPSHRSHMHVRFQCARDDSECRDRGPEITRGAGRRAGN